MSATCDVAILGGGPAAAAAAVMLEKVGVDTLLSAPPISIPDAYRVPNVLLPSSALDALAALGMRERVEASGTAVRSHEIRWPGPDPADVPGRASGVHISEPELRRILLECVDAERVDVRTTRASAITWIRAPGGFRATGVRLSPGGAVGASLVLCALPSLLPPECRPARAGPAERARTAFLSGVDVERLPQGHHYLACEHDGWSWALRDAQGHVQLTRFCGEAEPEAPAAAGSRPAERGETSGEDPFEDAEITGRTASRDATPSVPGKGPWPLAVLPIGAALCRVSPVSSLGTAQAIRGARSAVAAAAAVLGGTIEPHDALAWHLDGATMRAARTHALSADTCREPFARFGSAYWRDRARDGWVLDVSRPIVRAARAARRFLTLSATPEVLDTPLRAAEHLTVTTSHAERGLELVAQRAVLAPGGRPVPEDLWSQLAPLARALGAIDPLIPSLRQRSTPVHPPRTLGALLASLEGSPGADPKRIRRSVGALIEHGIIQLAL